MNAQANTTRHSRSLGKRAMEHDSPTLLFNLACEYLVSAKTIRPGVVILAKMVASARTGARALTWPNAWVRDPSHRVTGE
jgi:hypothetical protein